MVRYGACARSGQPVPSASEAGRGTLSAPARRGYTLNLGVHFQARRGYTLNPGVHFLARRGDTFFGGDILLSHTYHILASCMEMLRRQRAADDQRNLRSMTSSGFSAALFASQLL